MKKEKETGTEKRERRKQEKKNNIVFSSNFEKSHIETHRERKIPGNGKNETEMGVRMLQQQGRIRFRLDDFREVVDVEDVGGGPGRIDGGAVGLLRDHRAGREQDCKGQSQGHAD